MNERYIFQLASARGVGNSTLKKAIRWVDGHNLSWYEFINNPQAMRDFGMKESSISDLIERNYEMDELFLKLIDRGIQIVAENNKKYPRYLREMLGDNCPPILFVRGNLDLLNSISVGFCGSRKVSDKGKNIASECARQLTTKGITVVSGYARGTDMAAHKSALENGGNTVFVLVEGILKFRIKAEMRELLNDSNHVFISQFMPNSTWNAGNAMHRNSVIIGLSRAMILIESGMSGGTREAGDEALRVGCPLFVVDFAKPEVSAEANPYFIAAGGKPIRGKNGIPNLSKVIEEVSKNSRLKLQETSDDIVEQLKFVP